MKNVIHIYGASGSGTSTLGKNMIRVVSMKVKEALNSDYKCTNESEYMEVI